MFNLGAMIVRMLYIVMYFDGVMFCLNMLPRGDMVLQGYTIATCL